MSTDKRKWTSQLFLESKYLDENFIAKTSELYNYVYGIPQLNLIAWNMVFRTLE